MTSTGKKARRQHGTRAACRKARAHRRREKRFGSLPVSAKRGNAEAFVRSGSW